MTPASPLCFRLADSELAAVEAFEGDDDSRAVHLRFSAAAARTEPAAGGQAQEGFVAGVVLVLQGARVVAHDTPLFGRVAAGGVRAQARRLSALPLPGAVAGPLRLELALAHGGMLTVDAAALVVRVDGELRFVESSSC
jgi:hypothetical protein